MRALPSILLAALCLLPLASQADTTSWQRLVGILQYLETDYPLAIESRSELEMEEQRAFISDALEIAKELGEAGQLVLPRLEELQTSILAEGDPASVSASCGELIGEIIETVGLEIHPAVTPDLEVGRALYAKQCALCHGASGDADVPGAEEMDPPPSSFLDPEVMGPLSPYKAFNTIRFGIPGTAMPGFPDLDDQERWALAFFLHTLRQPPCSGDTPGAGLDALATSTDDELAAAHGEGALPCLRRNLPVIDEEDLLLFAQQGVERALQLAAGGDAAGARRELLDAYLLGIEPAEPRLRARDARLVLEIESSFLALRAAVEGGRGSVEAEGAKLLGLIGEAREAAEHATMGAVFWVAMLIVLREGFEAILVVGALLTVLRRMGQSEQAKLVHAGWVSALVAGGVAFAFGQRALAGANREWLEGIAALLAVAMLLYHITWLSARANVAAYMKEVRGKMEGALGRGSTFGLFSIAFVATFRESFETVLFMQGLSIDSTEGVIWGSLAGLVGLAGLVLLIFRAGVKLPLPLLFKWSSILLFGTAVVLLGKGLRALQEVGAVPLWPIPGITLDLLGVYPDAFTALPQLALLLAPLPWWWLRSRRGDVKAADSAGGLAP